MDRESYRQGEPLRLPAKDSHLWANARIFSGSAAEVAVTPMCRLLPSQIQPDSGRPRPPTRSDAQPNVIIRIVEHHSVGITTPVRRTADMSDRGDILIATSRLHEAPQKAGARSSRD